MPVHFDQMNAKISNYQNNGPLNALVHVIVDKMAVMPDDPMNEGDGANIKTELLAQFEAEWGTSLGQDPWKRLHAILLGTTDSMHKEILLGPVLRRMLPLDENLPQLSDKSVAKLAKRFGIRAEFYEDFAGMRARIKTRLAVERPGLDASALDKLVSAQFKAEVQDELRGLVENDLNNRELSREQIEAKRQAELKRIDDGLLPSYAIDPEDTLKESEHQLDAGYPTHLATLRVYRKEAKGSIEYRFGASNHGDPANISSIDTATHNFGSYTSNPVYEQTAPHLKPLLQAAVRKTIEVDRPQGSPVDVGVLVDNVSKIFVSDETKKGKAKDQQDGESDPLMGDLLNDVKTFFGKGVFDSAKGIWGFFEHLFGSMMKMILGFQEKMIEMNKQPGDPLTKKELEENQALSKAAKSFALGVKSLDEGIDAQNLNEAWRSEPNSIEAWVGLIEALVEEGQLSKADRYLGTQEKRMLENLLALKKDAEAFDATLKAEGKELKHHPEMIQNLINDFHKAIDPLEENAHVRKDQQSVEARLDVLKEVNAKVEKLQALKEAQKKAQTLEAEGDMLYAEQQAATSFKFTALLQEIQRQWTTQTKLEQELGKSFTTLFDQYTTVPVLQEEGLSASPRQRPGAGP